MKLIIPLKQIQKMGNYILNNRNKNLNWKLIEEINWGKLTQKFPQKPYD